MRVLLVCLLLSAVCVSADLQSFIEEASSYLPMKELESIGRQYVAISPSLADSLRYVQNVTYDKVVKDFFETKDGQRLIEYSNELGFDIERFYMSMSLLVSDFIDKLLEPIMEDEKLEPAISGDLMADYKKVIGGSDYFVAVQKKLGESPELSELVGAYKDPKFRALLYRASYSKDLQDGKNPQARGFWKNALKAIAIVALGSIMLG